MNYFSESFNNFYKLFKNEMKCNIVNTRKLHRSVVDILTRLCLCGPGLSHHVEILGTTRPSCSYRASTAQNTSCRAVLRIMPKDRVMTRPQMAWPKSQLYSKLVSNIRCDRD